MNHEEGIAMQHCVNCSGSGTILGTGMVSIDCKICRGEGVITKPNKSTPPIDKQCDSYRAAIKEIRSVNKQMTKSQAEELFNKAYYHE